MTTLIRIGAIALVSLICSACNWTEWVKFNVKEADLPLTAPVTLADGTWFNRIAFVDLATSTAYFDHECAGDGVCMQRSGDEEWWRTHEYAHVAYMRLGMPLGSDLPSHERGAQCIAEVVLHRSVIAEPADQYWDCPPGKVRLLRRLMVSAGMLDEQRALVT